MCSAERSLLAWLLLRPGCRLGVPSVGLLFGPWVVELGHIQLHAIILAKGSKLRLAL